MTRPTETSYLRAAFVAAPVAAVSTWALIAAALAVGGVLSSAGLLATVRTTGRTWLVSMGSGLSVDGGTISIVPVGAVLAVVAVGAAAVRWSLPDPVDGLPAFVAATGGVHACLAGVIASVVGFGGVEISPVRATIAGFVVGAAAAAVGATSRHGGSGALWFTVSEELRRAVRAGLPAAGAVLGAAAVVVLALLIAHRERAGDLWALVDPGAGGGLLLGVACLLAVPTMVLWAASALIGPGFAMGTDTSVDLTGAHLGAVPGFPPLAALPSPGETPGWTFLLGLIPVLAGAWAGWRSDAGGRDGWGPRLAAGAAAGAVAGFVLGVLVGASGGALGPGRMAEVGPPALTPLLVAVPVMALGGAVGAALAHYRDSRADDRPATAGSAGRPGVRDRKQPAGAAGRGSRS